MSEIIVLSDSNDSVSSVEDKQTNEGNKKKSSDNSASSDFDFPEVHFQHAVNTQDVSELQNKRLNKNYPTNSSPRKCYINELEKFCSKSSSGNEDVPPSTSRKKFKRCNPKKPTRSMSDSCDSKNDSEKEEGNIVEEQKKGKTATKKSKSQLTEERLKRQEQLAKEKALKAIALKRSKDIKPGECMKFMEVLIDKGIENFDYCTDIKTALLEASIKYTINTELIPNSITWKRNIEKSYVDETNKICTITDAQTVNQALIIWNWDEAITRVADNSFSTSISSIKALLPEYNITLVIYGTQDYFAYRKKTKTTSKNGTKNKTQKSNARSNSEFKNVPEISKRKLETCLNEVQITTKCNNRLIDNPQDLALMICQYTKAIAEIPYKLEKNKNLENKFDWYVMGDNRNTVRVDKDGNGLKRLWQQQLCQFNLSSLEIAEAICSVYPSPANLIEAYMNCTHDEGINLLKDIPIRRAAGPLTATRKIGLEFSKKVYTMFTSENGEAVLR